MYTRYELNSPYRIPPGIGIVLLAAPVIIVLLLLAR
jgi:hypothetical protein